jgi:hypothetical protein
LDSKNENQEMIDKLLRLYDNQELAPTTATLPPEASYVSVVVDAYTAEIIPVENEKNWCM